MLCFAFFYRRGDHAGAHRFREDQGVAGFGSGIRVDFLGVNQTGDGVAKFCFFVADAVAADHGASGFHHFRKTAGEDASENFDVRFIRKAYEGERGDGTASHGVDVAEGVGGGDLSEGVWIVDDGREEVDGLHERQVGSDQIHSGVVGVIEAD